MHAPAAYGVALENLALIIPNTFAFITRATTIAVARHYRRPVPASPSQ